MKKIFYKGTPYEGLAIDIAGKKKFALYHNDQFMHFVDAEDLDKTSRVSMILDDYYATIKSGARSAVLQD